MFPTTFHICSLLPIVALLLLIIDVVFELIWKLESRIRRIFLITCLYFSINSVIYCCVCQLESESFIYIYLYFKRKCKYVQHTHSEFFSLENNHSVPACDSIRHKCTTIFLNVESKTKNKCYDSIKS